MLRGWLDEEQHRAFLRCRQSCDAFAAVAVVPRSPSLFDWAVLDGVLRAEHAPDLLTVRRSELVHAAVPRSHGDVRGLFEQDIGIVIRRAEGRAPGLQRVSAAFAEQFEARVHLQLFVTPGGTHGFGWHYDVDDVVIVQTLGVKQYYFRANTQEPRLTPDARPDFTAIRQERSPLFSCTLAAGDALYLPRGMWHMARAVEDSFSLSFGMAAR